MAPALRATGNRDAGRHGTDLSRKISVPRRSEREPRMQVTITDPVHHMQYLCTPLRQCMKMEYRLSSNLRRPRMPDPEKMRDVTVEELGTSNISGVEVEGKRVTRVIPEGRVGNDRPFTTSEEVWHSKELDVDVQLKRADPRMGTRTTTMTEVILGEPDPKYFQIPEGYRVEDRKPPTRPLAPLPTPDEPSYPPGIVSPNR